MNWSTAFCRPARGSTSWSLGNPVVWVFVTEVLLSACTPRAVPVAVTAEAPRNPSQVVTEHLDGVSPKAPEQSRGPLTVDRAIEEALKASPELGQIQQRMAAATEQVRQAESTFYPKLSLVEEYSNTDNPVYALMNMINQRRFSPTIDFNNPGAQQNFSTRIQAEVSLFEGGKRWHDLKAAGWYRDSSDAELASARNQLVAKVTETYYRWLQAIAHAGVAKRVLDSAMTDQKLGEARAGAEMALPSEVMRLKARTAEARANLLSARTGARRLQAGIERLIARALGPAEVPEPAPDSAPMAVAPSQDTPESLVKRAIEKRPEMAAARALILAASERVESAKGDFLPKIGASVRYEWDTESFSRNADSWLFGVQASWPIFEGGRSVSRLREAKARLNEMESRGRQVALDIALEVTQAALAFQESLEKVGVAEERKKWAETALREVQHQYRDEVAGVDSLLQAETAWSQAEVSLASALFEAQISNALLKQSLGDFAGSMEANDE